jgi:hypothetical protein
VRSILFAFVLLAACGKGKPTNQDPPKPTGSGSASAAPEEAPDVALPAMTGTPPNKAKVVDAATLQKLADMKFTGWTLKQMEVSEKAIIIRQTTASPPKMSVTTLIRSCATAGKCLPMEVDKWKADDEFNTMLLGKLKDTKDTTVEIGSTDFAGQPMITSYVLGQAFAVDANGNSPGTYKYTFGLHYNDGTNMIQVIAGYGDMPLKTKEAMAAAIPRADLDKAARAFMDVYTHNW